MNSAAVTQTTTGGDGDFRFALSDSGKPAVVIQTQHIGVGSRPGHILPNAVSGSECSIRVAYLAYNHLLGVIFQLDALQGHTALHPYTCIFVFIQQDSENNSLTGVHVGVHTIMSPAHAVCCSTPLNINRCILIYKEAIVTVFQCSKGKDILLPRLNFNSITNRNRSRRDDMNSAAVTQTAAGGDGDFCLARGNCGKPVVIVQPQHIGVGGRPGHILPNAVSGGERNTGVDFFAHGHLLGIGFQFNTLHGNATLDPHICFFLLV